MPLLNNLDTSMQRYVRCMLDPRLQTGYTIGKSTIRPISCPIVDPFNPFIPILTNNALTASGWPDQTLPVFSSTPGVVNQTYIQVDGSALNPEAYTIDMSFRNTHGDPILYMLYIWMHYAAAVNNGTFIPYIDFIAGNAIDYNSRIYRLTLDRHKHKVSKICSTGPAIPVSNPTGSFFDLNADKPYNDQTKDITVRFQCAIFEAFDDILFYEFNKTVEQFNPLMRDGQRDMMMSKIARAFLPMFNNRGYPRIDPETRELEWWIQTDFYETRLSQFVGQGGIRGGRIEDELFQGD